jgi:hypothetical protein
LDTFQTDLAINETVAEVTVCEEIQFLTVTGKKNAKYAAKSL